MTPAEVFLVFELKRPKQVGGLSEADYELILEMEEELRAQGYNVLE